MIRNIKNMPISDRKSLYCFLIFLISVLTFGLNSFTDAIFVLFWSVLALSINIENTLYLFLFLSFFDDVFVVDILKGSANRVILVIILIKLLLVIIKNIGNIKIKKQGVWISIYFLISVLIGFNYSGFSFESLTIFLNVLAFVMFSIALQNENKKKIFISVLKTILCAVSIACIFGLTRWNFMNEITSGLTIIRFKGTYEPNFMCFYIDLAILSVLILREKFSKFINYFTLIFLVTCAGLTISVTGILTLALIFIIYLYMNRSEFKKNLQFLVTIGIGAVLTFVSIQAVQRTMNEIILDNKSQKITENNVANEESNSVENENNGETSSNNSSNEQNGEDIEKEVVDSGIGGRASELFSFLENKDLDKLTSGRLPLAREFLSKSFDRPLIEILVGNGPTTKMLFTNFFFKENYSHNSYLDLLYNFGVIGFFICICFLYKTTKKNYFLGVSNCLGEYNKALKFIRIIILIYAFSLSLYTKRMVLLFFLI